MKAETVRAGCLASLLYFGLPRTAMAQAGIVWAPSCSCPARGPRDFLPDTSRTESSAGRLPPYDADTCPWIMGGSGNAAARLAVGSAKCTSPIRGGQRDGPLRYSINATFDGCCHHEAEQPPDEDSMRLWTARMEGPGESRPRARGPPGWVSGRYLWPRPSTRLEARHVEHAGRGRLERRPGAGRTWRGRSSNSTISPAMARGRVA